MAEKLIIPINFYIVSQHLPVGGQVLPSQRQYAAVGRDIAVGQHRGQLVQGCNFTVEHGKVIHRRVFFRVMQQGGYGVGAFIGIFFNADCPIQPRLHFARQYPTVARVQRDSSFKRNFVACRCHNFGRFKAV